MSSLLKTCSAITVDVEDGINIAMRDHFNITMPPTERAEKNTNELLDLFSRYNIKATFFMVLSLFSFWIFIKKQTTRYAILAGLCLGLAQLSKYSMLLLYPIFILLFIMVVFMHKDNSKKLNYKSLLLIFLVSIIVIWAGYGFRLEPVLHNAMRAQEKLDFATSFIGKILPVSEQSLRPALEYFLMKFPMPFGEHLLGVMGVLKHSYQGHNTYFLGEWSSKVAHLLLDEGYKMIQVTPQGIITKLERFDQKYEDFIFLSIKVFGSKNVK